MWERLKGSIKFIREYFAARARNAGSRAAQAARSGTARAVSGFIAIRGLLLALGLLSGAGYLLYLYPPVKTVGRGEAGIRLNRMTGEVSEWRDGSVLVVPGLHEMRIFPLRDQTYRPEQVQRADGPGPVQSLEGLSLGVDLQVRYALDPAKLRAVSGALPDNLGEAVEPAVNGVIYKVFARYTVREIFSSKRVEIQQLIE